MDVNCIFCCQSFKVAKRILTLVNQLHEGKNIYLSQLILDSLYETLGLAIDFDKTLKYGTIFLLLAPSGYSNYG